MANSEKTRDRSNAMSRYDLTVRLVQALKPEDIVIGGIGNTNFDLWAAEQRERNFYMLGSMGLAIPIALGVALTKKDDRVIALEGDGSILMQLGVLSTVAWRKPHNLGIIVMDNGCYQITGSQPTPSADFADIAGIARASGIRHSATVASLEEFEFMLADMMTLQEPWIIVARIDGSPPRGTTERDPIRIRQRFMEALAD